MHNYKKLDTQLLLAKRLHFIGAAKYAEFEERIDHIQRMNVNFRRTLQK